MVGFFIFLALTIISVFFMGFFSGKTRTYNTLSKKEIDVRNKEIFSHRDDTTWIYFLYVAVIFGVVSFGFGSTTRDEIIDNYRNHKIVEQVTYKYQKVDGEIVLTDSTFCYIKNKEYDKN